MATNSQPTPAAPVTIQRSDAAASARVGGTTEIADAVVAKIIGIAVREVRGVYALGGGVTRAVGAIRDALGGTDLTQGVGVEVGETQVATDVTLVAEYPVPLHQIAADVRAAVHGAITELVGLEVAEVNVTIGDVHIPSDDDDDTVPAETETSRVK